MKTEEDTTQWGLFDEEILENGGPDTEITDTENNTENADNADNVTDTPKTDDIKGVFVYLGPTIRGIVTNGMIIFGTKADVFERLSGGLEKYPLIAKLVFRDKNVAAAREKISNKTGSVYVAYKRLEDMISGAGTHKEG